MNTLPGTASDDEGRPEDESGLPSDALVDEIGEESFPGSDPPATWAGRDGHR